MWLSSLKVCFVCLCHQRKRPYKSQRATNRFRTSYPCFVIPKNGYSACPGLNTFALRGNYSIFQERICEREPLQKMLKFEALPFHCYSWLRPILRQDDIFIEPQQTGTEFTWRSKSPDPQRNKSTISARVHTLPLVDGPMLVFVTGVGAWQLWSEIIRIMLHIPPFLGGQAIFGCPLLLLCKRHSLMTDLPIDS